MKTVMIDGPKALAASEVGAIAPTVNPMAEAAKASTVTIPDNLRNLCNIQQVGLVKIAALKRAGITR